MTQKDGWRVLAVCLVLGLGTIGLYAPAFTFNFVNLDELLTNPHLNKGLAEAIRWAFQAGNGNISQPLPWLSHALDCQIYGLKPAGHHATSLLLHAFNATLVFLVLRQLTGAFWRSAVVAAFFAWHPLHVESVAWVAQRAGLLCAFFWLLTLWAYACYAEKLKAQSSAAATAADKSSNFKVFYVLSVVFFVLALMSNPMASTLPLVLLVLDWWPLGRLDATTDRPVGKQALSLLLEKIPFFILSAASIVLTSMALSRNHLQTPMAWLPFRIRLVTAGMSCFHYLAASFWPSDLAENYPFVLHWPKWELIGAALMLLAVCVGAVRARNTRPYWLAGWLWFLFALLPMLNLVPVGAQPMADRHMYLPSIGLWMLVCWEAYDLAAVSHMGRKVLAGLCAVLLAACCGLSSLQLQAWKNEGTLLARIPKSNSNSAGHADYAAYLLRTGQLPQAQAEGEKAVGISPDSPVFPVLLGDIFLAENKVDAAKQKFQLALRLDPKAEAARMGLGRAFLAQKQAADAAEEFRTVCSHQPKNLEARLWLARTLRLQGKADSAVSEYRALLALKANQSETFNALNELAWLLATYPQAEIRRGSEAVQMAKAACTLTQGREPAFLGTLAAALAETGDFDNAVKIGQSAHDEALAQGRKALAETNLQLITLYRAHKPFREKQ
jgi:protein O-mannosyl-transferase